MLKRCYWPEFLHLVYAERISDPARYCAESVTIRCGQKSIRLYQHFTLFRRCIQACAAEFSYGSLPENPCSPVRPHIRFTRPPVLVLHALNRPKVEHEGRTTYSEVRGDSHCSAGAELGSAAKRLACPYRPASEDASESSQALGRGSDGNALRRPLPFSFRPLAQSRRDALPVRLTARRRHSPAPDSSKRPSFTHSSLKQPASVHRSMKYVVRLCNTILQILQVFKRDEMARSVSFNFASMPLIYFG